MRIVPILKAVTRRNAEIFVEHKALARGIWFV